MGNISKNKYHRLYYDIVYRKQPNIVLETYYKSSILFIHKMY